MDIFIKPVKKAIISGRRAVMLKDIAEVYCRNNENLNVGETIIFNIPDDSGKKSYLISVIDIVKEILKKFPDASVNNLGEMDTVLEYSPVPEKSNKAVDFVKVIFVCIVLFGGAMTAIMSFNNDAQMPAIFMTMHRLVFGYETSEPYIIYIPYSIGLAAGIIVFFNHFGKKYITQDPTPIEVEMTTYEKESTDCIIDNLVKEKSNGAG